MLQSRVVTEYYNKKNKTNLILKQYEVNETYFRFSSLQQLCPGCLLNMKFRKSTFIPFN